MKNWKAKEYVEHYMQKKLDGMEGEPTDFCYEEIYNLLSGYALYSLNEQPSCPKCSDYGTIVNDDGTRNTCPCHY